MRNLFHYYAEKTKTKPRDNFRIQNTDRKIKIINIHSYNPLIGITYRYGQAFAIVIDNITSI